MRTILAAAFASVLALGTLNAVAAETAVTTVAAVYKDKDALAGKEIRVQGKVVKVNNGIMGRNFLHLQDGTGGQGNNDLTVTTNQTAQVGDKVTVTGRVILNRDFGYGYKYPLLLEDATIAAGK